MTATVMVESTHAQVHRDRARGGGRLVRLVPGLGLGLGIAMGMGGIAAATPAAAAAGAGEGAPRVQAKAGTGLPSNLDPGFHPTGRIPVLNAGSADTPEQLRLESVPGALFDATAQAGPTAVLALPDGRVLVAAGTNANGFETRLRMFNADGTTDTSWGSGGVRSISQLGGVNLTRPQRLTLLPDGGVLVSFSHSGLARFWFAKLTPTGQVDTSFGDAGLARTDTPGGILTSARPVADSQGRILVAGSVNAPIPFAGSREEYAICRFLANGQLDTGFSPDSNDGTVNDDNKDGCFFHNVGAVTDNTRIARIAGLTVDAQDRPYLAGPRLNSSSQFTAFALLRLTADGVEDAGFPAAELAHPDLDSAPGRVFLGGPAAGEPKGLLQRADGRLLVVMSQSGTTLARLAQFLPDGRLDTAFAGDGIVDGAQELPSGTIGFGGVSGADIALDSQGRVVILNRDMAFARFLPDGLPDTGFGALVATPRTGFPFFGTSQDVEIALDPQDRIFGLDLAFVTANTGSADGQQRSAPLLLALSGGASADVRPDPFTFADRFGVAAGSQQTSNTVTVSGLADEVPALIRVQNGSYSIGCSTFTTAIGLVTNGDTVCVRHTAGTGAEQPRTTTTLIVGAGDDAVSEAFVTDTRPFGPAAFDFIDRTVSAQEAVFSNTVRLTGLLGDAVLTLSGHPSTRVIVNGGPLQTGPLTVTGGDTLRLRQVSSPTPDGRTATVSVGDVTETWTVTTVAPEDTVPDAFDFVDVAVPGQQAVFSNIVRVSGINRPVELTLAGHASARVSINGGALQAGPATVSGGDTIRVRLVSAPDAASRSATVTLGGVSDTWTVTTTPQP